MAQASSGFQQEFTDTTSLLMRQMYGSSLSWAWSNRFGIPDPSFALQKEINAYELIRRDTHCAHVMGLRKHAVAGTETTCVARRDGFPLDEIAAQLGDTMLAQIDNLDSAKLNLADAVFRSQSFAQIMGERRTQTWVDGVPRQWWTPTHLRDIDKRRFRWVANANRDLPPVLEMSDVSRPGSSKWDPVEHPEWLIQHVYDDSESTLGYGRGLIDAMYVSWYMRTRLLIEMAQAAERFGQGAVVVEVDPNRKGSTEQTNEAMLTAAADNVAKNKARHVLACLTGEKITMLTGSDTGFRILTESLAIVTNELTQLVLGSVLPSGGGGDVGSNARAEVEQDTGDGLIRFDRKLLSATLTRDLMGLFWKLNRANLIGCGLALAQAPRVELSHESRETPERFALTLKAATDAGMDVVAKEAYTRLGLSMPKPGEAVVKKAAPVMAPGFGGGPPGGPGDSGPPAGDAGGQDMPPVKPHAAPPAPPEGATAAA